MSVRLQSDILFRLMLSECATVRELLGVDTAEEALAKITTDAAEDLPFPRIIVVESDIVTQSVDTEFDSESHQISAEFGFYVPEDAGVASRTEEKQWAQGKFDAIERELDALRGKGEPIEGVTHLWLLDVAFHQPERVPADERFDEDTDPSQDLPLWFGGLSYKLL